MLTNSWSETMNPVENPLSRGFLIQNFLTKEPDFSYLKEEYDNYQGFNLIYGNVFDPKSFFYQSNRSVDIPQKKQIPKEIKLNDGVHVVSNSFLDDLTWPKTKIFKNALIDLFKENSSEDLKVEELQEKLIKVQNLRPCSRDLPKYSDVQKGEYTESDYEFIGNIFVCTKKTKTRAQTIVIVDKENVVHYFYGNTEGFEVNGENVDAQNVFKEFKISK
jgi:uncharacterized protein with NRDE domain